MSSKTVHKVRIEWGDADPARIVFYPNYFRWFDAAGHQLFESLGISHNDQLDGGRVGFPIVEAHAEFRRPGMYADHIEVRAEITEVGAKVFKVVYQVWREDVMLLEGYEKRVIAQPHPEDPKRIQAVPIEGVLREKLLGGARPRIDSIDPRVQDPKAEVPAAFGKSIEQSSESGNAFSRLTAAVLDN